MTHPLHDVAPGAAPRDELNMIVEIPRGSRNKYELHKESGLIRLDRLLYSAVYYPGDYGFVPRTLASDGDPLDLVCMVTVPTFPGCLIEVRPIGLRAPAPPKTPVRRSGDARRSQDRRRPHPCRFERLDPSDGLPKAPSATACQGL